MTYQRVNQSLIPKALVELGPAANGDRSPRLPQRVHKTVLVVDLVESVRLMAEDESGVIARWQRFLSFTRRIIPANGGLLVKSLGDGILAHFDESGQAVETAHQLHRYFAFFNASVAPSRHMRLRAGINATHLYADAHDVYGQGVNLAARVTSLAPPGGTVITASVRERLIGRWEGCLEDRGESLLKHWPEPVRTWCVWPEQANVSA